MWADYVEGQGSLHGVDAKVAGTDVVVMGAQESKATSCSPCHGGDITGHEMVTIKYAPTGERKWERTFRALDPVTGISAVNLNVDEAGRVFATGTMSAHGLPQFLVVAYGEDGTPLWSTPPETETILPNLHLADADLDSTGALYLVGGCAGDGIGDSCREMITARYREVVEPTADIKANGSDEPLILGPDDPLTLTVTLDAADRDGSDADWWLLANTPLGWYHYTPSGSWRPGQGVSYQGPLYSIESKSVFDGVGLPAGVSSAYFGVDLDMDGAMDDGFFDEEVRIYVAPR